MSKMTLTTCAYSMTTAWPTVRTSGVVFKIMEEAS